MYRRANLQLSQLLSYLLLKRNLLLGFSCDLWTKDRDLIFYEPKIFLKWSHTSLTNVLCRKFTTSQLKMCEKICVELLTGVFSGSDSLSRCECQLIRAFKEAIYFLWIAMFEWVGRSFLTFDWLWPKRRNMLRNRHLKLNTIFYHLMVGWLQAAHDYRWLHLNRW